MRAALTQRNDVVDAGLPSIADALAADAASPVVSMTEVLDGDPRST
jgi:hypothetical protein